MSSERVGAETRAKIVEVAIRLWGRRSYADVSVRDLVEGAGITKGGFYHHFASKEDLLIEIHDEALDQQIADMRDVIDLGLTAPATLSGILERFFGRFGETRHGMHIALREMRALDGDASRRLRDRRDEVEQLWVAVLERGAAAGELVLPGPPRLTAFAMIGVLAWAYEWFDPNGEISPTEFAQLTANLLLEGLAPRPLSD